jgi:plastocyanin
MKKYHLFILFIFCVFASSNILNAQTTHIVEASNYAFTPMNVNIVVGDTVEWRWVEGIHTTTSDSGLWDAPLDNNDQVFRYVFTSSGIHNYYCIYHQGLGMVGTITASPATGVREDNALPSQFMLQQNYPNPFNPSTVISYLLNKSGFVTLKVYNSVGEEVAVLVNEDQSAGAHSVVFNASESINGSTLASGVYFYRLKTDGFDQTRKMLLLK